MVIPAEQPFFDQAATRDGAELPCRILIVDDDVALRRTLPHVLAHSTRQFDECGTVAEALEKLAGTEYDLILLDYRLPDGNGLAVLDWLAERHRGEAVIMISGEDAIDAAIGALRGGADDFVRKPYHVVQMQRTVQNVLHRTALERANRAMSQRLHASERLHRYLVESSPDLIFTLDADGCFSYLNPRVEALLGFERAQLLRRPFILLVMPEDQDRIQALLQVCRSGRSDGFSIELRLRRNRHMVEDGENTYVTVALNGLPMAGEDGAGIGLYGVARDISERKRAEEIITFQAYHDQLTRLPNRVLFRDRLELAVAQAQRRAGMLAVMFIDVDRFKLVNDTYGHAAGDALLRNLAERLGTALRRGDTLARLGGDEFTILLPDISRPEDAETTARKILDTLARPFALPSGEFRATVSIGISIYPRDGKSAEELTKHADVAMYKVKRSGKNGFRFFDAELNAHHRQRVTLENDLHNALERNEFELHFQPQVSMAGRRVVGMEALLRWNHPLHGQIGPAVFIPVAEEMGLITDISRWVLDRSCHQLMRWRDSGHTDLRMSLNLSPHDFDRAGMVDEVLAAVTRYRIPPAQLELEITESMMMQDTEGAAAKVQALRAAGLGVAIDDFGTGYSSLSYLQKFPVSCLKIDRSFVGDLYGPALNPIISAITGIARGFGLQLIAEGVEQAEQVEVLRSLGCDVMQGYYFAHPAAAAEAEQWLQTPPCAML
ncbi:putative bifunctional diguanylate cyclase/phosphodiesterase [Pseudothauera rhizosphaerae]|uniref:EAL domain-containing protein n=1 Tax=Pseudothauera rhizosphaerae TaxID=2565932 RepID=A0A4S4APW7_9RHOO|nr:EAL domain-containing protein [Pseudothauera rhizosphaerae]THF61298.1 EAL domain-containing protein [Pseudothauera rhizosphaerae]